MRGGGELFTYDHLSRLRTCTISSHPRLVIHSPLVAHYKQKKHAFTIGA